MKNFHKNRVPPFSKEIPFEPEKRKSTLLNAIMYTLCTLLLTAGVATKFTTGSPVAYLDLSAASLLVLLIVFFRLSGNLIITSWLTLIVYVFTTVKFIIMAGPHAYSFITLTILPAIAILLVGLRWGVFITFFSITWSSYYILNNMDTWPPINFGYSEAVNIVTVTLVQTLLLCYYELSRQKAFREISSRSKFLEDISNTDKLTQTLNRRRLDEILDLKLRGIGEPKREFGVIIFDVDDFKIINDQHGHLVGDKILIEISDCILKQLRNEDYFGRWGGEEFLLITHQSHENGYEHLSERLRSSLCNNDLSLNVTASFGFSVYKPGDDYDSLIGRADKALYKAKKLGKNRVVKG